MNTNTFQKLTIGKDVGTRHISFKRYTALDCASNAMTTVTRLLLMNVVIACEDHFLRTPDGKIWTTGQFPYPFWTRYLSAFDSVRVVARVRDVAAVQETLQSASGVNVAFTAVPDYHGPEEYLRGLASIRAAIRQAVDNNDAVILRVPGQVSSCVARYLRKRMGRPFAVEVVADPFDAFSPGAVRHPLRRFFRWWFPRKLRQICSRACAATYVTQEALQCRYPAGRGTFVTYFSDVELSQSSFLFAPRNCQSKDVYRLIFVGSLAQLYKAPDVLIDAVGACVREALNLKLVVVGSGQYRSDLASRAAALGIGKRVEFLGQLTTKEAVRSALDRSDLFVLPSRQEGLPRAMIEAMARALPCIGSTVGGIPELLDAEDLVSPNDAPALAKKIAEVLGNPARMRAMSARNLRKAQEFNQGPEERRQAFYRYVRNRTQAWLNTGDKHEKIPNAAATGCS